MSPRGAEPGPQPRPTIEQLAARTGARLLVTHDGSTTPVQSVVLCEPDSQQRIPAGSIVLALGYRADGVQFTELVAAAASAGAVAVVAKPSTVSEERLRELGETHGISTILAAQSTDWLRLASMLHSAAAVSSVDPVAGIRVGDLFGFANAIALASGGATAIVDPAGRLLGFSNLPDQPLDEVRRRATLLMAEPDSPAQDPDYQRLYRTAGPIHFPGTPDLFDRVAVAVRSDGEILGSVWVLLAPGGSLGRIEDALVELGEAAAVHLHHARADLDLERLRHTQLLQALLRDEDSRGAVANLGLAGRTWFRLAVFVPRERRAPGLSRQQVQSISNWLSIVHSHALFAELDARLVVLFNGADPAEWEPIERGLSRLLRTSDTLREAVAVATSSSITEPDHIGVAYERLRTLTTLLARGVVDVEASPAVAMDAHWARVELATMAQRYAAQDAGRLEALTRIRDYDDAHGSAYWSTLAAFVAHDRRYADAAAAMHVHVNTVRYRIDRLTSMFGLDLSDPATFLWVAVQLHGEP